MQKFNFRKAVVIAILSVVAIPAIADEQAVAELDQKVNLQVSQIEQTGMLPTYDEIEMIKLEIIDEEVRTTDLTAAQAVEKYQLTPMLERTIRIKEALRQQSIGTGGIVRLPPPPTDGSGGAGL